MSGNPFVSGPVSTSTPLSGTFLLEDGQQLATALENGDWIDGGLAAFSTVMDSIAMASDPLGQLFAMGFGWLLEHMQPLQGWLNQLTGDPAQVEGFAQSWSNISGWLSGLSGQLQQMVSRDLTDMSGDTIDAYYSYQRDLAALVDAGGQWAAAMATAMGLAQTVVQIVHDIVRDAIAQVAGALCSYIVELVFSVGLATPLVIEQATTRTAEITTRISKSVTRLIDSGSNLAKHSDELAALFRKAKNLLDDAKPTVHGTTPNMPNAPRNAVPHVSKTGGDSLFSHGGSRTNRDVLENGGGLPLTMDTIEDTARSAGIDLEGIDVQIALSPDDIRYLDSQGAMARADDLGIQLGPAAFADKETLIRALAHERTHVDQFKNVVPDSANRHALEAAAYAAEQVFVDFWKAGGGT